MSNEMVLFLAVGWTSVMVTVSIVFQVLTWRRQQKLEAEYWERVAAERQSAS